jgi:flagellar hook-length control protein FliK
MTTTLTTLTAGEHFGTSSPKHLVGLSEISFTQTIKAAMESGANGNKQAEKETMDILAVQNNQATSAQTTARQTSNDAFSSETSFDRVLDQQVSSRRHEQKKLDAKASEQSQSSAPKEAPKEQAKVNETSTSESTESTDSASDVPNNLHLSKEAPATEEVPQHMLAINHAMQVAEVMRPSQPVAEKVSSEGLLLTSMERTVKGKGQVEQDADTASAHPDESAVLNTLASNKDKSTGSGMALKGLTPTADESVKSQNFANNTAAVREAPNPKGNAATLMQRDAYQTKAVFEATEKNQSEGDASHFNGTGKFGQSTLNNTLEASSNSTFSSTLGALVSGGTTASLSGLPHMATPHGTHLSARVHTPVGQSGWNDALGQHLVTMVSNSQQTATLTLNPPDLGPLKIVLQLQNTQADAAFITAQPEVKQALEDAMPKLREMMEQAGIQLGQTTVNTGSPQQQMAEQHFGGNANTHANNQSKENAEQTTISTLPTTEKSLGLVDTFA